MLVGTWGRAESTQRGAATALLVQTQGNCVARPLGSEGAAVKGAGRLGPRRVLAPVSVRWSGGLIVYSTRGRGLADP
jgi:hypothetical protein